MSSYASNSITVGLSSSLIYYYYLLKLLKQNGKEQSEVNADISKVTSELQDSQTGDPYLQVQSKPIYELPD